MIDSKSIQSAYIDLYSSMRKYLWDLEVVEILAEIEAVTFFAFVELNKLRLLISKLESAIRPILVEDIELKDSLKELAELLNSSNDAFLTIYQVTEVQRSED